jgi:hypothetical protein
MIDQESLGLGEATWGEVTKKIQKKLVWNGKGFKLN